MNEQISPAHSEDAAWASINSPLSADTLLLFCRDIERLFRINPMLEFKEFRQLDSQHFQMCGNNTSQHTPFEFDVRLSVKHRQDGIQIEYDQGVKSSTLFRIEAATQGAVLTITDLYERLPVEERQQHLHEVDKSLVTWADYLQRYLLSWSRWSKYRLWRWYMHRIWQPMKPASRRITYSLLWISAFETALIGLGVLVYIVEYR